MYSNEKSLQELQQIKTMMERSSKFISLSGLSGIAAGVCGLTGFWIAFIKLREWNQQWQEGIRISKYEIISELIIIAVLTFMVSFITAFFFTWLRSKKSGVPLWGKTTVRLLWNIMIPLVVGGLFLLRTLQLEYYDLLAPGCLIFYGLALVNAAKYTLGEVRYLGYAQLLLGSLNLWMTGYGLYFWAAGFGLLHIFYGLTMWYKYERVNKMEA